MPGKGAIMTRNVMKDYHVFQKYANIEHAEQHLQLAQPLALGTYPAKTIFSAVRKASRDWKLSELLLSAEKVTS